MTPSGIFTDCVVLRTFIYAENQSTKIEDDDSRSENEVDARERSCHEFVIFELSVDLYSGMGYTGYGKIR